MEIYIITSSTRRGKTSKLILFVPSIGLVSICTTTKGIDESKEAVKPSIFLVLSPSELVENSLVAALANQATAQAK